MATAVANKEMSIMDYLAAARSELATAEAHVATLRGTFPDTFLAGLVKLFNWPAFEALRSINKEPRAQKRKAPFD